MTDAAPRDGVGTPSTHGRRAISNIDPWRKKSSVPRQMEYTLVMNTALKNAASSLHISLEHFAWFRMVGIGNVNGTDGLIVYVSRSDKKVQQNIPTSWEGFAVVAHNMSQPSPLGASNGAT